MKQITFFILSIFILSGCCKDHSDVIPGQNFISDEILENIRDNGQPIYEGYNPPLLEGTYRIAPLEKISSTFNDINAPLSFGDEVVTFYDYDEKNLTLKVSTEQGGSKGRGFGSFISGEGNIFTIYVKLDKEDDKGVNYVNTKVYSGEVTENGISDLTTSIFMIDDAGDPNNEYIENGQGRTFIDGNYFSEKMD